MHHSRARATLTIFLATAIGGVLGFALGIVVGWNTGFSEADGSSEVLYSDSGSSMIPEYWYVVLNHQNQPILRSAHESPLLIDSANDYIVQIGPGGIREVGVPIGGSDFESAHARFVQQQEDTLVSLIVSPSKEQSEGWPIQTYTYTVDEHEIRLVEITRRRPFNEWGGEVVFLYALGMTLLGVILGCVAGVLFGCILIFSQSHVKRDAC